MRRAERVHADPGKGRGTEEEWQMSNSEFCLRHFLPPTTLRFRSRRRTGTYIPTVTFLQRDDLTPRKGPGTRLVSER